MFYFQNEKCKHTYYLTTDYRNRLGTTVVLVNQRGESENKGNSALAVPLLLFLQSGWLVSCIMWYIVRHGPFSNTSHSL